MRVTHAAAQGLRHRGGLRRHRRERQRADHLAALHDCAQLRQICPGALRPVTLARAPLRRC